MKHAFRSVTVINQSATSIDQSSTPQNQCHVKIICLESTSIQTLRRMVVIDQKTRSRLISGSQALFESINLGNLLIDNL